MNPGVRRHAAFCVSWLAPVLIAGAQPRIFFSDLDGGPKSGGPNNQGAIVTVYGKNFGAARGSSSVTVGGGNVAAYLAWSDEKISFQLGSDAASGDILVITPAGRSNGAYFAVRPGKIYLVATTGNDRSNGSLTSPWRTLLHARDSVQPGDIIYAFDGVSQTTDDGAGWSAALTLHATSGGSRGSPKALVAYPGATVTIGNPTGPPFGIRSTGPAGYWTFAGLVLRGSMAVHTDGPSAGWRFVANDMSCPKTITGSCFSTSKSSEVMFFGNQVHDVGQSEASAMNHGVYFSTDSNHLDVGWNVIARVRGCRGLQVHSTVIETGSGYDQYDISIHDNLIHDTQCDGIVLATVDPSKGKVEVFNNLIYDAGQGPENPEHTGHWSCIIASGYTNAGPSGGGTIEVYNNTLFRCGTFANPTYSDSRSAITNGGHNPRLRIRIRNNIIVAPAGVPYVTIWTARGVCREKDDCGGIYGSHNLFFGSGPPPRNTGIIDSISGDPLFVNAERHDFRLQPGSPAKGTGAECNTGTHTNR